MQKHGKTAKVNIPMFSAAVLLCLTLVSIYLVSGLYAKYTVTNTDTDTARVIRWGNITLTETGDFYSGSNLMIIPGVDLTKKAVVDFEGSEAASYVFVEVIPTMWETEDNYSFAVCSGAKVLMQWSIEDDWTYLDDGDDASFVYYRALKPNDSLVAADVIDNGGAIAVSEYITQAEMQTLTNVSIKLRATAVQANGFDAPNDAWSAIAAKGGSMG